MSTGEEKGCGSGWCIGAALIIPFFIFATGASRGNLGIVAFAVVLGVVLVAISLAFYRIFTEPGSSGTAAQSSNDDEATPGDADMPRSAKPGGQDYEPWTTPDRMKAIVGEFYQQQSYGQLAKQLGIPRDGTRATVDLAADLGLDRCNPHARHGTAITVWIEGVLAGYLSDAEVPAYLPVLKELEQTGRHLTVRARIYLNYDTAKKKWRPSTLLKLPEPDGVLPRNPIPEGDIELIPSGRVIQVIGEENHMEHLSTIVDPSGPSHLIATLRPTQMGTRTFYDTVQVLIDGQEVGTFSRAMGEQTVSLVKLIEDAGLVPVARATVEGNSLRAEVKIRMQRAAEFDQDRIHQLQSIARERRANTTHRGEAFDWDDDDLLNGPRKPQDRDAEDGGA